MDLSDRESERYDRHLRLPGFGLAGQRRLKASSILLIGAGGLGCPAALYLAAAGVGRLTILDDDLVERSNLQRQIAHGESSLGMAKAESLRQRLSDLNPDISVQARIDRLGVANAAELVADHDLVLDGSDNFPTRYLVNDACRLAGKPFVSGAIHQFEGQVGLFLPAGPCYRCLFPKAPPPEYAPDCSQAGVLGVLPGVVGGLMATEALKYLAGLPAGLASRLLHYQALEPRFRILNLSRDENCPLCGTQPSLHSLQESEDLTCPSQLETSVPVAMENLERGWVFLDVREESERRQTQIEPSHWVPLAALEKAELPWSDEQPLIVYCQHGMRSLKGAAILRARGFSRVLSLKGGIVAWHAHRHSTSS
jgi:adenylyltransferase/sulfurtransferase